MRYRDSGNVHKDFHLGTARTVRFILERYGMEFLRDLFRRTAQLVYRDIHESLKDGDPEALVEHWEYYYGREGGVYETRRNGSGIAFAVKDCPMVRHLRSRGVEVDETTYLPDVLMNEAWSEGTPFDIRTDVHGEGVYTMTIGRKDDASE